MNSSTSPKLIPELDLSLLGKSINASSAMAGPSQGNTSVGMSTSLRHTAIVLPLALLYYLYNATSRSNSGPTVKISNGLIQGIKGISRDGRPFHEFLGIPYASPPIGQLRFEMPHLPKDWSGVRSANSYGPKCIQIEYFTSKIMGQEDCLYLNVFTPKMLTREAIQTETKSSEDTEQTISLLPVMVFIHGGYFMSGTSQTYRPEYFMDKDVVLVTLNYRVASFGFLNTEDDIVRGNMGMKDQVMALKWVQTNIAAFGGDPEKVTIFGCSAGASSVHYHTLSPMSKGLFQKAISQSGSAIKPWSFVSRPAEQARRLGEKLKCPTNESVSLVRCLKGLDSNKIIMAHWDYLNILLDPLALFAPSIESVVNEDTFLHKHPYEILQAGEQNVVPYMTGLNSDEGLLFTARILKNKGVIEKLDTDWEHTAPLLLAYSEDPRKSEITTAIRKFYLRDEPVMSFLWNFQNYTDMLSDRLYFTATKETALLHSKSSNVYMYYYTYPAEFSFANILAFSGKLPPILEMMFSFATNWVQHKVFGRNATTLGRCHGDELLMLFNLGFLSTIKPGDPDYEMSKSVVNLWVQFATDEKSMVFGNQKWNPIDSTSDLPIQYLNIDLNGRMIEEPFTKRVQFWKSLDLL